MSRETQVELVIDTLCSIQLRQLERYIKLSSVMTLGAVVMPRRNTYPEGTIGRRRKRAKEMADLIHECIREAELENTACAINAQELTDILGLGSIASTQRYVREFLGIALVKAVTFGEDYYNTKDFTDDFYIAAYPADIRARKRLFKV